MNNQKMTQEEFFQRYKYDLVKDKLGEGGFGKVFRAYDTIRDREVAIKIAEVKSENERFTLMAEYERSKSIPLHPNIAHYENCFRFKLPSGIFDFGVLQYYPQGNLSKLIQNIKLGDHDIKQLALGILEGIKHLHENGLVHRDLKPENILVSKYGDEYKPKISDFGISKQVEEDAGTRFANTITGGALLYASPEQLKGAKTIRKNTDLWSFGVILYEMVTGDRLFGSDSGNNTSETARIEIYKKIISADIEDKIKGIEEPYYSALRQCLTADPENRLKSAGLAITYLSSKEEQATVKLKIKETSIKTISSITYESENQYKLGSGNIETLIYEDGGKDNIIEPQQNTDVIFLRKIRVKFVIALSCFYVILHLLSYFFFWYFPSSISINTNFPSLIFIFICSVIFFVIYFRRVNIFIPFQHRFVYVLKTSLILLFSAHFIAAVIVTLLGLLIFGNLYVLFRLSILFVFMIIPVSILNWLYLRYCIGKKNNKYPRASKIVDWELPVVIIAFLIFLLMAIVLGVYN